MECPSCRYANDAMAARCAQCNTTLSHAAGHPPAFRSAVLEVNTRMFVGVGSFAGFVIMGVAAVLMSPEGTEYGQLKVFAVIGAIVGGLLGRYIAWKESRP